MLSRARLALLAGLTALSFGCPSDNGGVGGVLVVASVEVTPGAISVVVNHTTTPLVAVPKTESGIVVPGRTVTWSSLNEGVATVTSDGVVTGHSVGGPVTIRATVDGIHGDGLVTVNAVPIDHITVSPPTNPVTAGASVQLTAAAFDAVNAPLTGRTFFWTSSDANVATVTTTGMVFALVAGGPVTITATSEGKSGSATVTVTARPADRLGFVQQPTTTVAGSPFNPTIKVAVQDNLLGTVTGATDPITIVLATNPGGSTLSGTTTVNAVNGIATFGNLTLNKVGTGYTLLVTSGSLTAAISSPFNIVAGGASLMVANSVTSQTGHVGTAVSEPPSVKVTDPFGNPVGGIAVSFAVTSGGGTLVPAAPTTISTNAAGVATVTSWTLGSGLGANSVTATGAGVAGSVVFNATGTASGPTTILAVSATTQSGTAGMAVAAPPSVKVTDGINPVAGVVVTFAVAPGNGSITGSATVTTNALGIATVGGWTLGNTAGTNTLTASATGLTGSPVIFNATGAAGPPTTILAVSATTQSGTAGMAVAAPPSVKVTDGTNPVAGVVVTFAVASGNGSITGSATVTTNASGIATVGGWTLGTTAGTNTLTASATGLTGSPVIFSATGAAGPPTTILAVSATTQSAPAGTAVATPPSVKVTDGTNPVAGVVVTFAIASGNGSITGSATVTTNTSGIATVGGWTLDNTPGTNTLTASVTGLAGSPVTFTATGTGVAPVDITANSSLTPTANAGTPVAGGSRPSVVVTDIHGNPVPGASVVFTLTTGGSILPASPATVTTDAFGVATLTSWTLDNNAANPNSVTASAGFTGTTITFTATGTAGPAANMSAISVDSVGSGW